MHWGSVLPVSFLSLVSCLPHWLPGHEGRVIRQSLDPIKLRWLTLWLTFDRTPWALFGSLWVRGLRSEECLARSLRQGKCPRSPDAQFLKCWVLWADFGVANGTQSGTRPLVSTGYSWCLGCFFPLFVANVLWSSLDFGRALELGVGISDNQPLLLSSFLGCCSHLTWGGGGISCVGH